jgi:uncharacterized protein (TIGR03067 family)
MRRRLFVLAAAATLAAAGQGPDDDRVAAEQKALAGTWVCEASEVNGVKRGPRASRGQTFTFDGTRFVQADAASSSETAGTYLLDLTGKQKVLVTTMSVAGRDVPTRYIYDRDGDTLKVCSNLLPTGPLPTAFSAPEGSRRMYAVFKRAAKR